jgi:hypothetical protein
MNESNDPVNNNPNPQQPSNVYQNNPVDSNGSVPPADPGNFNSAPPAMNVPTTPQYDSTPQQNKRSGLAIAAFVLALLGVIFIPFMVIAVVLAVVSLIKIKKTGERGRGFVIAALLISLLVALPLNILVYRYATQSEETSSQTSAAPSAKEIIAESAVTKAEATADSIFSDITSGDADGAYATLADVTRENTPLSEFEKGPFFTNLQEVDLSTAKPFYIYQYSTETGSKTTYAIAYKVDSDNPTKIDHVVFVLDSSLNKVYAYFYYSGMSEEEVLDDMKNEASSAFDTAYPKGAISIRAIQSAGYRL